MGNWVIHIEGTGAHHNSGAENDADVIAKEAVKKLPRAGQNVEAATFTAGGRNTLFSPVPSDGS